MTTPTTPANVQSVDRTFDLIETLSRAPEGLLLGRLATETALHKSTAHRLLATLLARGYVAQDQDSKRYHLTLRLFELGGRIVDHIDILEVARTPLEQLRDYAQEAVHLVLREQNDIIYIHKAESHSGSIRMFSRIGMRRPMYCTAVGKSILATLPEAETAKIWFASKIERYTRHTIVEYEALRRELAQIRTCGYALDNEENEIGVRCLATSVPDYTGRSHAAFSISAPIMRMPNKRIEELTPELLATRDRIGIALGIRTETE